jgi:DNA-binding MarR family transcriptional regulator
MAEMPVSTVYLLKRAELAARGCAEVAFASVGLTPSQFFILLLVKFGEASSSAELAREMGVMPQSMTELLAPLEKSGAIVRRPDPGNQRILRIELTSAGHRTFDKGVEVAMQLERELFKGFAERDLEQLNRLLAELTAKAEGHEFHPKLRRLNKAETKSKPVRATRKAPRRRAGSRR